MKVTIENYTECCLKTWGGEHQKERAELGIIGEFGEVAEVLKKFLRGDFDEVERDRRLLKELGDSAYYIAIDIHLDGELGIINLYNIAIKTFKRELYVGLTDSALLRIANSTDYFTTIKMVLELCARYGFTLEQVMQANIDKLTERSNKGKIKGDGSDR